MPAFSSLETAWDAYLFTNHTFFHAILDTLDADAIFKQTNRTWLIPTVGAAPRPPAGRASLCRGQLISGSRPRRTTPGATTCASRT
jgi:hypothetical protein